MSSGRANWRTDTTLRRTPDDGRTIKPRQNYQHKYQRQKEPMKSKQISKRKRGRRTAFTDIVSLSPVRNGRAYDAGYDCGINGPNTTNCHFTYFSTKELTEEWERGKSDAMREKQDNA